MHIENGIFKGQANEHDLWHHNLFGSQSRSNVQLISVMQKTEAASAHT